MPYYKVVSQNARVWRYFKNNVLSGDVGKFPVEMRFHADVVGTSETGDTVVKERSGGLYTKRVFLEPIPEPVVTPPPPPDDPPSPVPSPGWKRYQVLHDWQSGVGDQPYKIWRTGDPEVFRIGVRSQHTSHVKVPLSREKQFFWADLIAMQVYGRVLSSCNADEKRYIKNKYGAISSHQTAFTNAPEEGANYVTGEYLDRAPLALAALICGGCTVWGRPDGDMVQIYSFIRGEPLPPVTPDLLLDPRVLWATAIYGLGQVYPFSHLRGLSVPYPLFTHEPYYFPAKGLAEYNFDEPFRSQYAPYRSYYP